MWSESSQDFRNIQAQKDNILKIPEVELPEAAFQNNNQ